MVTSGASNGTFSPGWTWRLATVPDKRRRHDGVAQRVARQLHLRLVGLERALGHRQVALRAVVGGLRDEVLLEQRLVLRPRLFGQRELRAARFERADPVGELRFEIGGVEAHEHLPGLDRLALADHDLADLAGHLRP